MDPSKEKITSVEEKTTPLNYNVSETLTDEKKEAWRNFMEKCQQSMDLDQSDPARFLAVLNQLGFDSKISWKQEALVDANQTAELSPEKRVFENHLLAKSIFKCLSYSDLLSCRLVNSKWNELATQFLLKRDHKIKFQRRNDRFYLEDSNWKSLDMLTQLLGTSNGFPCTSFSFEGGNLGNDDAQRFFSFYGPCIKSIEISEQNLDIEKDAGKFPTEQGFSMSPTDARVLGMILSQQLPNLQVLELYLDLERNPTNKSEWYQSLLFPPEKQTQLPNLKHLKFEKWYFPQHDKTNPILRQILTAAVNLQQFHDCEKEYVDLVLETGREKSIRKLYFPEEAGLEFDKFEELAEHGLELYSSGLGNLYHFQGQPEFWNRISTFLPKLFESSRKSLKILYLTNSIWFLPQLQLPVLENVKELSLTTKTKSTTNPQNHEYSLFLPRGATFARNFPQLDSIRIVFGDKMSNHEAAVWWSKCFSIDEIVPTVKTLVLVQSNPCPDFWLRECSRIFPNLTTLFAPSFKDFAKSSRILWTGFKRLAHLHLSIQMASSRNRRSFILDSCFTGIPPEKIKSLQSLSLATLEQMGGSFGQNPSILNLTDLQTLVVDLDFAGAKNQDYRFQFSLNHVTGLCAFSPLERLQKVEIELNCVRGRADFRSILEQRWKHLEAYKVTLKM